MAVVLCETPMAGRCQGLTRSKEFLEQNMNDNQEKKTLLLHLVVNCLLSDLQVKIKILPKKSVYDLTNLVKEKFGGAYPEGIKLLFNLRVLDEKTKLNEISGLKSYEEIYAVARKPVPQPQSTIENTANQFASMTLQSSRNRANRKLVNCKIFHRNFKSCINASLGDMDPSGRIRHNDPETRTSNVPMVSEAGEHILEMAESVKQYALEISRLSNLLIMDPVFTDAEKLENARRLVQNNIDAARYLYPYLQNFSTFAIPLSQSTPRKLMIYEP